MFCGNCGKEIPDNSATCVFCGNAAAAAAKPPFNVCALLSMILGLLSPIFLFLCYTGIGTAIASLILGIVGISHANKKNSGKKGMAITGIIFSVLTFVIFLICILFVGAVIAASEDPSYY